MAASTESDVARAPAPAPAPAPQECLHVETIQVDGGFLVCRECCREVEVFSSEPEWPKFAPSTAQKDAGSRCRVRRRQDPLKGVFGPLSINPPAGIRSDVARNFLQTTAGRVTRGEGRLGIIAASYMMVMANHGEYRTSNYIITTFGLTKQTFERSFQRLVETFPEYRLLQLQAEDLVKWTMSCIGVTKVGHVRAVRDLLGYITGCIPPLRRCSPQTLCSAMVFFYIQARGIATEYHHIKAFASRVYLSDITIQKQHATIAVFYSERRRGRRTRRVAATAKYFADPLPLEEEAAGASAAETRAEE
jgi:hypothetical protein